MVTWGEWRAGWEESFCEMSPPSWSRRWPLLLTTINVSGHFNCRRAFGPLRLRPCVGTRWGRDGGDHITVLSTLTEQCEEA